MGAYYTALLLVVVNGWAQLVRLFTVERFPMFRVSCAADVPHTL